MAISIREQRSLNTRRPFSRAEARTAGIRLRELLGSGFHKIFFDCYVAATVPITTSLRADAALGVSPPGSCVSHHTAAQLWGGRPPESADTHVTVPDENGRSVRQGLKSHIAPAGLRVTKLRGVPITTPQQTFLDLAAAGLDLVALVVLGDSLIKACGLMPQQFVDACAGWHGRGAKRARKAAGFLREGVDSAMESRLRMLLVLAGLPEPTVNHILRQVDGAWKRRLDLCFPSLKLIIEYDGRHHAENSRQWLSDLKRREELDALGWRIIVITRDDFYLTPDEVLVRVRDALIDRGANGVRRRFKTEWMRYFGRD